MKKLMNSRRHKLTVICLIVGLLVLTTSVYANFDSANGYSNYKDAVKNLAFHTNDVTLDMDMEFIVYDEALFGAEAGFKINEDGKSEYTKDWEKGGYESEVYVYYQDGKQYRYWPDDNEYYEWDYDWNSSRYGYDENLLGVDTDDKMFNKAVRFVELGADLLIGDLKNNVVLLSNEGGIREYQVDVSRSQMPEIVNAGISLIFTSYSGDLEDRSYVTYEDWMECYETYFVEHGGDEELFNLWHYATEEDLIAAGYEDWDDFYEKESERYDEITFEFDNYYEDMFADEYDRKGILYVHTDGSVTHYETYKDYLFREGNAPEYWYYMFGEDPYVSNAKMTVKLNENNELIENYFEGTLTGVDDEGDMHTAQIKIRLNADDYGTTVYDEFDPEGKEKRN